MNKISVMRTNFEGTEWKKAFADAVLELRPDMNPDRADELSDAEYLHARAFEPAVAAQRWFGREQASDGSALDKASNGE